MILQEYHQRITKQDEESYQFYYEELYRKSFYNKIVDKNLQTDNLITPTWEAYFFRIINIFNRNSDLNKLPGLQEVRDLLTFKSINELILQASLEMVLSLPSGRACLTIFT